MFSLCVGTWVPSGCRDFLTLSKDMHLGLPMGVNTHVSLYISTVYPVVFIWAAGFDVLVTLVIWISFSFSQWNRSPSINQLNQF